MNQDFGTTMPTGYMGQITWPDRETLTRWTVAGVVTMAALLAARAVFKRRRRRRR